MRLLREPLLHFAVLGVALFALHRQLAPADESQPITVDANLTAALRADHQRRTGATPTAEEEDALLERHLDSEVLYRAALDLGLERGDVIVRRRLIQKMEFILENAQPRPEPPDTELQAYLEAHAERYALPERLSLTHVFVSNERAGGQAVAETEALRQQLLDGAAPEGLGDRTRLDAFRASPRCRRMVSTHRVELRVAPGARRRQGSGLAAATVAGAGPRPRGLGERAA
jgi:hypothetical protein